MKEQGSAVKFYEEPRKHYEPQGGVIVQGTVYKSRKGRYVSDAALYFNGIDGVAALFDIRRCIEPNVINRTIMMYRSILQSNNALEGVSFYLVECPEVSNDYRIYDVTNLVTSLDELSDHVQVNAYRVQLGDLPQRDLSERVVLEKNGKIGMGANWA